MNIEVRANGVHIEGYVNVVERESRAVITPRGKVNETILQGTFDKAIATGNKVNLMVDHERVIGDNTTNLKLAEDAIGLRADLTTDDEEVVKAAKEKKIRGWSFGFSKAKDIVEERADKLPLRKISGLSLNEVSLIIRKNPVYSATSIEVRAEEECEIEQRAYVETEVSVHDTTRTIAYDDGHEYTTKTHTETVTENETKPIDYSQYVERLNLLKK